jgi:hypothetical protein
MARLLGPPPTARQAPPGVGIQADPQLAPRGCPRQDSNPRTRIRRAGRGRMTVAGHCRLTRILAGQRPDRRLADDGRRRRQAAADGPRVAQRCPRAQSLACPRLRRVVRRGQECGDGCRVPSWRRSRVALEAASETQGPCGTPTADARQRFASEPTRPSAEAGGECEHLEHGAYLVERWLDRRGQRRKRGVIGGSRMPGSVHQWIMGASAFWRAMVAASHMPPQNTTCSVILSPSPWRMSA